MGVTKPILPKKRISRSRTGKHSHAPKIKRRSVVGKKTNPKHSSRKTARKTKRRTSKWSKTRSLAAIKKVVDEQSISPDDIRTFLKLLKKYGNALSDLLSSVRKIRALEKKHKKSYDDVVEDYESKIQAVQEAASDLKIMEKRKQEISLELEDASRLENLKTFLSQNNASGRELVEYIEAQRELGSLGFDANVVKLVGEEMKRLRLDPKEFARMIGGWMSKGTTLEHMLIKLEEKLAGAKKEESLVLTRVELLNRQVDEQRKKIAALQEYMATQSRTLESEYEARRRVLDARIQDERLRAEQETLDLIKLRDQAAGELRTLKEEAMVRKEMASKKEQSSE